MIIFLQIGENRRRFYMKNIIGGLKSNWKTILVDLLYDIVGSFSEGLAKVRKNGKEGYINSQGEEVIPCIYEYAWNFSEGLAKVRKNGREGYINPQGEEVIPCIYDCTDDFSEFSEGLAKVYRHGRWSIINAAGKVVVAKCGLSTSWSEVEF